MTNTDTRTHVDWLIDDAVCQFRLRGTEEVFVLRDGLIIGADASCDRVLSDPDGLVSKKHARTFLEFGQWAIADLKSKNGLRMDGISRPKFPLYPGLEVGIGGLILVAESPRSIALRRFLQLILGWAPGQLEAVDAALQAVRAASAHRRPLGLVAAEDAIWIARTIHRHAVGSGHFIECNQRRGDSDPSEGSTPNVKRGLAALTKAAGGTLCVWVDRKPPDFREFLEAARKPRTNVFLIMCTRTRLDDTLATPIRVPALAKRTPEVPRIISELADEATTTLGLPRLAFTESDHAWVLEHEATSFTSIERATLYLTALRQHDKYFARAATRLGVSEAAIRQWLDGRRLPDA